MHAQVEKKMETCSQLHERQAVIVADIAQGLEPVNWSLYCI
jgi:hypothetical protein